MAFTCIVLSAPAVWATVTSYIAGMADCGANLTVFDAGQLAAYNASILAGGSTAASSPTTSSWSSMTIAEATPIFTAIALLWGLAFTLRAIASFLKSKTGESEND